MIITYRNFTDEDIDGIIRFWNENSGWETNLDRAEFDLRFCSSPWGAPIIMLAIDKSVNEIAGFCCFIPLLVSINGLEKKCYRPFGAIFKETIRKKFGLGSLLTGQHPILQLYHHGAREARQNNAALTYLIPDHRWAKLSKIMPFQTGQFAMWSCQTPFISELPKDISIEKIETTDPEIDVLWEKSDKANICMIAKSALSYDWKIKMRHGGIMLWGIKKEGQLVGLFTLHFKAKEGQCMIGDLLTFNNQEFLNLTLKAACLTASREYGKKPPEAGKQNKISILTNALLEQKVRALGFYRENYTFLFAVHLLNGSIPKKEIAPQNWYVSASD